MGRAALAGPVGAGDTLLKEEWECPIRTLKAERDGEIEVAGPRPPLRLASHDRIGEDVLRLSYVPA